MTDATEVHLRRLTRWLTTWVVVVGLAAAGFTGSAVAWADTHSRFSSSTTSSGGEGASATDDGDRPSTLPAGIRIADRTLNNVNDRGGMESLRLQMAMDRLSRLTSTLTNVLRHATETAQTVTQNIK